MQAYQNHMPMEDAQLLEEDIEKMRAQIDGAFERGADEIKIFKPTEKQVRDMTKNQLKKMRRKNRKGN